MKYEELKELFDREGDAIWYVTGSNDGYDTNRKEFIFGKYHAAIDYLAELLIKNDFYNLEIRLETKKPFKGSHYQYRECFQMESAILSIEPTKEELIDTANSGWFLDADAKYSGTDQGSCLYDYKKDLITAIEKNMKPVKVEKINKELEEALECSLKLYKMVESAGNGNGFNLNEAWKYYNTIKQVLTKIKEQEKENIRNKQLFDQLGL